MNDDREDSAMRIDEIQFQTFLEKINDDVISGVKTTFAALCRTVTSVILKDFDKF